MKKSINYILFLSILLLFYDCEKESVEPQTFRDSIIGKWEIRETFNAINNLEQVWRPTSSPYITFNFRKDSTFVESRGEEFIRSEGTFAVSETDSIITLFMVLPYLTLAPEEFNGESFIISFTTDEGLERRKYFKLEE